MARLTICLDDLGLHDGVNAAAWRLAALGRLDAASAMVGAPAWAAARGQLGALSAAGIDIGLHLDLTEAPLRPQLRQPLSGLIVRAFARRLPAAALRDEIEAQLDAFEDARGAPPDHVDGHQHVHQLPQVREALLSALRHRYPRQRPWLRCTRAAAGVHVPAGTGLGARLKPHVIEALGAVPLERAARAAGFVQNGRLLGVYGFEGDEGAYERWLAAWLAAGRDGDLLMCHAALGAPPGDAIAAARGQEARVLCGERFGELLATHRVTHGRLQRQ